MKNKTYDKKKYEIDFPDEGYFNWKTVKFTNPAWGYYKNAKIVGVLLHDGNFLTNGVFLNLMNLK